MKVQKNCQSRRNFLKQSLITAGFYPLLHENYFSLFNSTSDDRLKVHIFSKHLQFLSYHDMAEAVAEMGFDGIDLTVRSDGHVKPERVDDDLPKAIEAMRKFNLVPLLMTTTVEDAGNSTDKKVLEVASKLGIKYYRMNWFSYPEEKPIPDSLDLFQQKIKNLSYLDKELGLTGCYQNHAGNLVGASIWELWELLKEADKQYMGLQYDIRHAVVEGGLSWQNGLRLVHPHIKTLAIKDFLWAKKDGVWDPQNVPLGEGMVDFKTYFKLLKQYRVNVPVSLHLEHPLGGAEHGDTKISVDKKVVFDAMKKDLKTVHDLWQQA